MCLSYFIRHVCENCGREIRVRSNEFECNDKKCRKWETFKGELKIKEEDCPKCIRRNRKKKTQGEDE
ncbi:hypothetical protein NCS52_01034300 [Fusarium sp. LHS14.1]|nr:hypothetical protein NCS52_01034300 [Fusarium sp. LHS14.1]